MVGKRKKRTFFFCACDEGKEDIITGKTLKASQAEKSIKDKTVLYLHKDCS